MKQVKNRIPSRILALFVGLFLTVGAFAQQITVNGNVKDEAGFEVVGASVRPQGQEGGAITDLDGNFTIKVAEGTTLEISYIGYEMALVTAAPNLQVIMKEEAATSLNEVVVIGYGVAKKSDLTGSVTALKPDTKNKGLVVNAQDMMQGKIAGVNVTSGGGTPGGGSTIRIRGGSSLNATNDPLIVIDGLAMDNQGVKGLSNPLSMVNPADIESFNVLKDASATAIYGSRGSNGVIIITTKKGRRGQKPTITYSGSVTVSKKNNGIEVLSGDEYRSFIEKTFAGSSLHDAAVSAMGTANTDWSKQVYQTALSTDHNLTVAGSVGTVLPYRVSFGYTKQEGIVKTSDFERYTLSLNLNPSFFDDHLTLNLNAKGMAANSQYADGAAISAAQLFDPTQPVHATYKNAAGQDITSYFGGYFQWLTDGAALNDRYLDKTYNSLAPKNPVSVLELKNDIARSYSFIGSADIDYKVHGFEDLRLHATLGADISKGTQTTTVDPASPLSFYYGSTGADKIVKRNLTFSSYIQYYKDFCKVHHFDIMAGYEWQHFWRKQNNQYFSYYPETNTVSPGEQRPSTPYTYKTENYIVSFFGRANYTLMDRYMLTATVRRDGSSRFKEHWATFPSFAFAYRIKEENFLKNVDWLSDAKVRVGWGKTGQQEGIGDYNYFAVYSMTTGTNGFYPVTGTGVMARPNAYDPDLTWETTTTTNVGLDLGFFNQRVTLGVDYYYRETTDLLNTRYIAAGTNFRNQVTSNIGSLENRGIEVSLGLKPIQTKDWYWTVDMNFTYNKNEITDLTGGSDGSYMVKTGSVSAGTGNTVQAHAVGHPASSFYVYQQVYDKEGNPIPGVVVDRNGDGVISESDMYFYKSPAAPYTAGLSSRLEYKNWDLGFTLRASFDNYVFNDFLAGNSNCNPNDIFYNSQYLQNRPKATAYQGWNSYDTKYVLTDHWVENGSFLKCDNITLGYSFAGLAKNCSIAPYGGISGRVYATVNNVFTVTNYTGVDPEVYGGIDNSVYPRPISFILGVNLNF